MGKKLFAGIVIIEILVLIFAACMFYLYYHGYIDPSDIFSKDEPVSAQAGERDDNIQMDKTVLPRLTLPGISADIEYSGGVAKIKQQIALTYETDNFRGYMYALNYASVTISAVGTELGTGLKSFSANGLIFNVKTEAPVSRITVEYTVELKRSTAILSYSDDLVQLVNFLIIPEVNINGRTGDIYTKEFGDPFVYEMYNYDISIKTDSGYMIYAPGRVSESLSDDGRIRRAVFSASNMRDFPIVLCKNTEVIETQFSGVKMYYIGAAQSKAFIEYSFDFAEKNIGTYPYKEFFIVKTPIYPNKGMEFSCMIFISEDSFSSLEALKNLSYHEVFHQWFYGIIGIDQFREPFMDEGLVTHLTAFLQNGSQGRAYSSLFMDMQLRDYRSKRQYDLYAYAEAAAYFGRTHAALGDDAFFALLKRIYNEKSFGILSFEEYNQYLTGLED